MSIKDGKEIDASVSAFKQDSAGLQCFITTKRNSTCDLLWGKGRKDQVSPGVRISRLLRITGVALEDMVDRKTTVCTGQSMTLGSSESSTDCENDCENG